MLAKEDYGDIDFLACGPRHSPFSTDIDNFDWTGTVDAIKSVFNTEHGHRGFLNVDCMYFAVRAPGDENDFWIQIDVKICFRRELFEWQTFETSYASNSKMIGSMVKPLGFTIDPQGMHIRVPEIEQTNGPGSMVWISKDPMDVLRVVGLDRRILDAGFETKDEVYEYLASSWLFNPAHFGARLAQSEYYERLEDRSPHWTYFIKEWVPGHYPMYMFKKQKLRVWYKHTREVLREKVFTMFPHVATAYYTKRAAHMKELQEKRLQVLITAAIPQEWKDLEFNPMIIIKHEQTLPNTPELRPTNMGELTPPLTPTEERFSREMLIPSFQTPNTTAVEVLGRSKEPWDVPLHLEPLPRKPKYACNPQPPAANFPLDKRLLCLARWTLFDPANGKPYLLTEPREKDFKMQWMDFVYAGATDEDLTSWAEEMWQHVWVRQSHVNYVGMWKKRFEKEDRKAAK
ncbi:hypothetical protein FB567DRAFT_491534 [Paraphoma chrysanthemicola]|uniref:Uncharacterized protein n=1 Tax=Paraphoma chrysanthemicola TaxID=798071 RepID=A0A8K0W223_9PLEO|nr:hypothetical protein FB567DRAFT_491534 [Paraphoma chrysanthemicola]